MVTAFRVLQIDHVELSVPDRYEAARWYERVLGLEVVGDFEHWAENPSGPLMISSDGGQTKLALFEGEPQGTTMSSGFHLVAFRVGADAFLEFLGRANDLQLTDHRDRPVTAQSAVDHERAYSVYFTDPYGHRLEVTTYDHEAVRAALASVPNR